MKTFHMGSPLIAALALLSPASLCAQFSFTRIADTNTHLPGFYNSSTFTSFEEASIDSEGVAFWGTAQVGGVYKAIFRYNCGICTQPSVIIGCLSPLTDLTTDANGNHLAYFNEGSSMDFGLFGDKVIFQGSVSNTLEPALTKMTLGSTVTFTPIAAMNDAIFGQAGTITNVFGGILSGSTPVFIARWQDNQGILKGTGPPFLVLVDGDTPVPGYGGTNYFGNHAGDDDLFTSVADDGFFLALASPSWGVYSLLNGVLRTVADMATLVPNTGGEYFQTFGRQVQVRGSNVIFSGESDFGDAAGIYLANFDGTDVSELVSDISIVPGAPHGFEGATFGPFDYEDGTLVFTSRSLETNTADGVFMAVNGIVTPILTKESTFSLNGKTVDRATSFRRGIKCGQVPVYVRFTDDSEGLYLTRVSAGSFTNGVFLPGSSSYSASNGFRSTFLGVPGKSYRIQWATNLAASNWITISNFTYSAPKAVTHPGGVGSPARFYRTVSP